MQLIVEETEELLNFLLEPIKIIPEEEYSIPIWSNDSAFKKQSLVKVYTTQELIKLLRI